MATDQLRGRGALAVLIVWALMLVGLFAMTLGVEWLHHDCPLPVQMGGAAQMTGQTAPEQGVQVPGAVDALDYRRMPRDWRTRMRLELDPEAAVKLADQLWGEAYQP